MGFLQQVGAHLGREPAGDLAHRRQQGQAAVRELDRFVGDGGGAGLDQGLADSGVGGEVQVGEEHLIGAEEGEFLHLGFLDLDHEVGAPGVFAADQFGPGGQVGRVLNAGPGPGVLFHPHREAMAHQLAYGIGG